MRRWRPRSLWPPSPPHVRRLQNRFCQRFKVTHDLVPLECSSKWWMLQRQLDAHTPVSNLLNWSLLDCVVVCFWGDSVTSHITKSLISLDLSEEGRNCVDLHGGRLKVNIHTHPEMSLVKVTLSYRCTGASATSTDTNNSGLYILSTLKREERNLLRHQGAFKANETISGENGAFPRRKVPSTGRGPTQFSSRPHPLHKLPAKKRTSQPSRYHLVRPSPTHAPFDVHARSFSVRTRDLRTAAYTSLIRTFEERIRMTKFF